MNVMACNVSTNVKLFDSGNIESMIYLFPTAANKPPTGKPKRGSMCSGEIKKLTDAIQNAMYMPINNLKNNPHAFRSNKIRILKES